MINSAIRFFVLSRFHQLETLEIDVPDTTCCDFNCPFGNVGTDVRALFVFGNSLHKAVRTAIGSEEEVRDYLSLLVNKLELRGRGCLDDRFCFASTSTFLRLIDMSDVPKPILEGGVMEVEWTTDVSQCEHMSDDEAKRLFESISA